MKRFNKKIYKDAIVFCIILLINVVIFKNFLTEHYTTDSYNLINIGYIQYLKENFLPGGRIFSALLYYIGFLLKIPYESLFTLSLMGGLIISTIMIIKLKNICLKEKEKWSLLEIFILIIASYYTIFNAMYLENLYFAETIIMALSVYFYMLAAKSCLEKGIIKSIVFACLGVFCYQGTVSAFFAFLILFELLNNKDFLEILKDMLWACCPIIVAISINMIQINLTCHILQIEQHRLQFNIIYNFVLGFKQVINMFMNTLHYGYYLYTIAFISLLTLLCKEKKLKNYINFLNIIIIVVICLGAAIIPTLSGTSALFSTRIRFSVGACIGVVYLFLVTKTNIFSSNKIISICFMVSLVIYGILNTYSYIYNIEISKKIDIRDIQEAKNIANYIECYEAENNVEVTYIAIYLDYKNSYKGVYHDLLTDYSVMNWSALRTCWSSKEIIEYFGNKKLEKRCMTEEEKTKYLSEVDTNKGYLAMGNTLYITCYIN